MSMKASARDLPTLTLTKSIVEEDTKARGPETRAVEKPSKSRRKSI